MRSSPVGQLALAFMQYWNGDPAAARPVHFCNGCCAGRDQCINTMQTLLLRLFFDTLPPCPLELRWGTLDAAVSWWCLAANVAHGLIRAAWLSTWRLREADAADMEELLDDDAPDVKFSKRNRNASRFLQDPATPAHLAFYAQLTRPLAAVSHSIFYTGQLRCCRGGGESGAGPERRFLVEGEPHPEAQPAWAGPGPGRRPGCSGEE
eukprot:7010719-Alexandrium_andersonii.AAC.1